MRFVALSVVFAMACGEPKPPVAAMTAAPSITDAGAEDGELAVPSPVTFRVRPLAGPGSMGPSEVSPESDEALKHVAAYLSAHPKDRLRVECAVNPMMLSSGPNTAYAKNLAELVVGALVERGVARERLEAFGILEKGGPAELIRFRVQRP